MYMYVLAEVFFLVVIMQLKFVRMSYSTFRNVFLYKSPYK